MKSRDYTTVLRVGAGPRDAFDAINDVRGWWAGEINGKTAEVGDEFTYTYENFHRSKQRVIELVPGKKVAWLVVKGSLNFVENKSEWDGTRIEFFIARKGDKTEIRFTHLGLHPDLECFDACANAWGSLVKTCLRDLIVSGKRATMADF
jgi:hypothetical protein